jgi:UDP-N-acetylglucosamine--N-acetylmuramyl-(pentapeptide) pyrophosphoryl-undecaprenol N-acetylglucosamine transferase
MMKIAFTGGGTGGHFFPIIAVAEKVNENSLERHLVPPKLYYLSDSPYSEALLYNNQVTYVHVGAGKRRINYGALQNFFDVFKTAFGTIKALTVLFGIFPDVIFSKGGYASVPTLLAARILGIPVVLHESDSVPGRTTLWASKFAEKIAVSYEAAAQLFPKEKTAYTGQPIRKEIEFPLSDGAVEYLKLEPNVPVILVLGGSLGAQIINEAVLDSLPLLADNYQIIHQTGRGNYDEMVSRANVVLKDNPYSYRYHPMPFLDDLALRMAAGAATLCISRAGSTIFELAAWQLPSIVIPITESNGDHQRKNAYNYARVGGCQVIEEVNLTPHLLVNEVNRIATNEELLYTMKEGARAFYHPDAAKKIADALLDIAISHEK